MNATKTVPAPLPADTLYIVRDARSEIVMIAPMSTLRRFYSLHELAEKRIEAETSDDGTCTLHFNRPDTQPVTVNRFLGSV